VCPASLKLNWEREAEMWLETDDAVEVIKNGKPHPLTGDIGIIILNYDVMKKWLPELKAIKPQVLIYDESHNCKNPKSQRSKAAAQLAKSVPHKILLTGTPVMNRPSELWHQLCIIDPNRYNSKSFFKWHKKYTAAHQLHFGQKTVWDFSGASNLGELAESLKGIMIRRTKAEVLPDLPAKRRQTLLVSIDNRREYDHAEKDFLSWIKEQKGHAAVERASSVEQLSMVEALRQIAIQGKMKQAIEWICDFLETGEKLVVFATHRATIDTLMTEFSKVAVRLDGGMCAEEKQLSVDRFQTDPEIRLFLGNVKAAGEGIPLFAASNALFVEMAWGPKTHEQCESRLHRIGQKNAVTARYMIAVDTIDEKIADMLEAKGGITSAAIGDNIAFKLFNTGEK
jgi:SWI/SNF-related matrix-associated actin-dependent regulator 1 of chromatin subfamily A